MRKIISGTILILLVFSVFPLASIIQPVRAAGEPVYIRADGLVDPSDAPILNVGNVSYTFTDDINESLVVERDNIVVDGAGYMLLGAGIENGISLSGRSNVTVQNLTIEAFEYGIYLSNSSGNTLYANTITNSTYDGIRLAYSSGNSVSANNVANNKWDGIYLYYSSNGNNLSANTIANNTRGIYLYYSSGNSISANNIANNGWYGIRLEFSSGNSICANKIADNGYDHISSEFYGGILFDSSSNNTVTANNITNNYHGVYTYLSSNNNLSANNITNSYLGIWLRSSSHNSVFANNVTNSSNRGIQLWSQSSPFSSNNTISANNVINNKYDGILLESSSNNNTISANYIANNTYGISLTSSLYNNLSENFITNNTYSVWLFSSSCNSVSSNSITNNTYCVVLSYYSNSNSICANNITNNNGYGIWIYDHSSSNSLLANTITGNSDAGISLMYSSDSNSVTANDITANGGNGIYLDSSSNGNSITGNSITNYGDHGIELWSSDNSISANTITGSNTYDGIRLVYSSGNSISANNVTNNEYGIFLVSSSANSVSANTITNNFDGVFLYDCSGNSISANTVADNRANGIHLYHSTGNIISANNITNNELGISLSSSNNLIRHNNFVDNTAQAYVEPGYVNVWDDGYPSGGNYWSDYAGVDLNNGPYQNVTGSDGIGDTHYIIDANNTDHYPLMGLWSPILTLENVTAWYWTSSTGVNSVAVGDVDDDGQVETVTGGFYNDGVRDVAQLVVWNSSSLAPERLTAWYWFGNTTINSVASGDVDGDGGVEIVTGGYFYDGSRKVAQLVVWNGSSLAVEEIRTWYWINNTVINSVAVGDVDGDGQVEVVTGGYFNDGARNIAQLVVWDGATLAVEGVTTWYWTSDTVINSVAVGDVDADGQMEIVTGGAFNDGARDNAQLVVWTGSGLAVDRLTTWYWTNDTAITSVALGDVDADGQTEIVTGGYFNDNARNVAQLVVWTGSALAVDRLTTWYWTGNTVINSVALGDMDGDGEVEVVTGGYYNDGARNVAQMVAWSGSSLAVENIQTWYWVSDTAINSVCLSDLIGDSSAEIVTGGAYNDGTRWNAQLVVWGMRQTV